MEKNIGLQTDTANAPVVSVVMPVYNSDEYLTEAVESILNQTFRNFEFLIIDDGSTDKSIDIITSFEDPRIRLIRNEKRLGLSNSLNLGLSLAKGEYIVRMDADDISLPERLGKQVKFMDSHPLVGVSGSWASFFGRENFILKHPLKPSEIKCSLFFYCALAHPTVILRKILFSRYQLRYDEKYEFAEDYDLWVRCASLFPLSNLGEVLVRYRTHSHQIGSIKTKDQRNMSLEIAFDQVKTLGIIPTSEEKKLHRVLVGQNEIAPGQEQVFDRWLSKLNASNKRSTIYPVSLFSRMLSKRWFSTCLINNRSAIRNLFLYWRLHVKWMAEFARCWLGGMIQRDE